MPDEITGAFIARLIDADDGYEELPDRWTAEEEAGYEQDLVDNSATIVEIASKEPYEENEPEVYGIAFPKSMLPSLSEGRGGVMAGVWTADEIIDMEGGTDEVFVRVWLYGPPNDGFVEAEAKKEN